jgi:hypothetical protein
VQASKWTKTCSSTPLFSLPRKHVSPLPPPSHTHVMAETVPPVAPAAAAAAAAAGDESVSFSSSSCACAVDANAATEPLDLEGLVAAIKEELARCKQTHISKQFGLQEILR